MLRYMTTCSHMKCPFCTQSTKIYNTRSHKTTHETWRRHRCTSCESTFTTRENIDWGSSITVETSYSVNDYSYGTLLASIVTAATQANLPAQTAIDLANTIQQHLVADNFFAVSPQKSQKIKDVAISVLSRYDKNLAIHYSNVVYNGKPPQTVLKTILEL